MIGQHQSCEFLKSYRQNGIIAEAKENFLFCQKTINKHLHSSFVASKLQSLLFVFFHVTLAEASDYSFTRSSLMQSLLKDVFGADSDDETPSVRPKVSPSQAR